MARAKGTFGIKRALAELGDPQRSVLIESARQATVEALAVWHREMLPLHFEASAFNRYRPAALGRKGVYVERSKRYEKRKAKLGNRRRPMVFTGLLRATLLNSPPRVRIARGREKLAATLTTAHHPTLNLWAGGARKHDFRASLTVFTHDEARRLREYIGQRTVALVKEKTERSPVVAETFVA